MNSTEGYRKFVAGAVYGYGPKEIEYVVSGSAKKASKLKNSSKDICDEKNKIIRKYVKNNLPDGTRWGYILHPDTLNEVFESIVNSGMAN
jgi:hypothetical protein